MILTLFNTPLSVDWSKMREHFSLADHVTKVRSRAAKQGWRTRRMKQKFKNANQS